MVWLLDGNVLTALAVDTHIHHHRALAWFYAQCFYAQCRDFATCAVTEGTLLRMHMISAPDASAAAAWQTPGLLRSMAGHQYWDDGFSYDRVTSKGLTGHRQVTDAWLPEPARRRSGRLATMDSGLAAIHGSVAHFVPVA